MNQKGFTPILILVGIFLFVLIGSGIYYLEKLKTNDLKVAQTNNNFSEKLPIPNQELINAIDSSLNEGSHFYLTPYLKNEIELVWLNEDCCGLVPEYKVSNMISERTGAHDTYKWNIVNTKVENSDITNMLIEKDPLNFKDAIIVYTIKSKPYDTLLSKYFNYVMAFHVEGDKVIKVAISDDYTKMLNIPN